MEQKPVSSQGQACTLPLGQVKAEVFDSVLASLGFFPRDCILPSIKEKGEGKTLPYSPPKLIKPAGDHLCTGGVCSHAGLLERI
jgi:hypothetical protein